MSSRLLTDEQIALVAKARERVAAYKDKNGEVKITCQDCAIMYVFQLLEVIDTYDFELDQLNK